MIYKDRVSAGRALAKRLSDFKNTNVVVLALPRGGVPVAYEVAREINAPLDVIVVRKLGVPFQAELAMGAVGEGGVVVRNEQVIQMARISSEQFEDARLRELEEVANRASKFREGRPAANIANHQALIVDDGIATGSTAQAACEVARQLGAEKVILAVPVGSREAIETLSKIADQVICLEVPENFFAVGEWYEDFSPVLDHDVVQLLRKSYT